MYKKNIRWFFTGAIVSFFLFCLLQNYSQLKLISDQETYVATAMEILVVIITSIISTIVAFLVVDFQMDKERENEKSKNKNENIRYLYVLKHENDANFQVIEKLLANQDKISDEMMLKKISETISVKYWEDLYLKIKIKDKTFEALIEFHRSLKLITGNLERDIDISEIKALSTSLNKVSEELQKEIKYLE